VIWILVLSLLALALSAWVTVEARGGGLIFGVSLWPPVRRHYQRRPTHQLGKPVQYSVSDRSVWVWLFEGNANTSGGATSSARRKGEEVPLCAAGRRWPSLPDLPLHAGA